MSMKLHFNRVHTPCPNMPFFKPELSDEWRETYMGKRPGTFGTHPIDGSARIPEEFHTETMMIEQFYFETDEKGRLDTNDKEMVKHCLRNLTCFAGLPSPKQLNEMLANVQDNKTETVQIQEKIKELHIRFFQKSLDPESCDYDEIIADLTKEIENKNFRAKVNNFKQAKAELKLKKKEDPKKA